MCDGRILKFKTLKAPAMGVWGLAPILGEWMDEVLKQTCRKLRKGAYTYSPFAKLRAFGYGGYSQLTPSFEWCDDDDDTEEKNEEEKKEVKIPEPVEYKSSSDDDEWSNKEMTYEEVQEEVRNCPIF
ncbi:hypothetical protein BDA99DRAFT_533476 [Phascolomyces articulosus]|uniref:Uncharacterized protein n=1 Tax=Phascolomyces articulosus TaxID=60185 RepID=A0AAD5PHT5_9FUNG|nr:hypothetical protein BDA99DRAFT_533476 [Phascolomyces articulosus]